MNRQELALIIDTAYRQWPHIEPDHTLADIWAVHLLQHDANDVAQATLEVLKTAKYPPTVADILEQLDGGDTWPAVAQLLQSGYFSRWDPLEPERFPNHRSYLAARQQRNALRELPVNQAERLYRKTYAQTETDPTPKPQLNPPADTGIIGYDPEADAA